MCGLIGDVSVEILEEGSKGLFGFFGSREAKVRLTPNKADEGMELAHDLFKDALADKSAPRRQERQKAAPRPKWRRQQNRQKNLPVSASPGSARIRRLSPRCQAKRGQNGPSARPGQLPPPSRWSRPPRQSPAPLRGLPSNSCRM